MIYSTRAQKLLLPALILITPFLVFLNHNSYCLACAETPIVFAGLILSALMCSAALLLGNWIVSGLIMAGLITLFIDLQFSPANLTDWVQNWSPILLFAAMQTFVLCVVLKEKFFIIATAIFSTFFIVTIFQVAFSSQFDDGFFEAHPSAVDGPPRIIHLILDEHIGIEGIPTDVEGGLATKKLITQFYLKNGFQLFGGAFSHYFYTHFSIGNLLNFRAEGQAAALISGRGPYALLQNKYFELLSEKKYRLEVLSPGWLDFCSDSKVVISACIERHWGVLKNFKKLELPLAQKVQVLASRYLSEAAIVTLTAYGVSLALVKGFPAATAFVNEWTWALDIERTRTDSLNTLADLQLLWRDIVSVPHGTVLFAHLSVPHYPYVALPDCSIRPPNRLFLWKNRQLPNPPPTNTEASRKEHYRQYFQQLECLYSKLDELIDRMRAAGVYENSIMIIHGDHGSRITINDPTSENRYKLTHRDLVDGFSTLFAMKLPGKPGGYNKSPRPLEELFADFVFEAGLTPANILPKKSEPYVYLVTGRAEDPIRIPYIPPDSGELERRYP